ncbi:MAG: tetratricopeptide repeat protein [Treponema sp.]|nr:tetratricopeptide repeat protein [Treponema sp.]
MKKSICILFPVLILPVLASCATSVEFDVRRPPLVDLRGVNSITIIPFEKNCGSGFEFLSAYTTTALTRGIQNSILGGNISFVDPVALANVPERDLWQYADVYITGRITGVSSNVTYSNSGNQTNNYQTNYNRSISMETATNTVTVTIEYSYIRSKDGKILETFRKNEDFSDSISYLQNRINQGNRNNNRNPNDFGNHNNLGNHNNFGNQNFQGAESYHGLYNPIQQNRYRGRRGQTIGIIPQSGSWEESLAKSAINRFTFDMNREFNPWTTTEERNIRRRAGNEPEQKEARKLVRANQYDQALPLYQQIYEKSNNVFAGYNNAILLAANKKFTDALELLQNIQGKLLAAGRSIPGLIKKEIPKMADIVSGLSILEDYRTNKNPAISGTNPNQMQNSGVLDPNYLIVGPVADINEFLNSEEFKEISNTRQISGTINLNQATIYALRDKIASADDDSVWTKIIASAVVSSGDANALGGEWSIKLPSSAPSSLWFAVMDNNAGLYITQTALRTSGIVVLDIAQMIRLK